MIPLFRSKSRDLVIAALLLSFFFSLFQAPALAAVGKIHPQVREAMAEGDFIEILIKLSLQPNPQGAALAALRQLPANTQPHTRKHAAGEAVLDTLQSTAASSQQQLLSLLETAAQNGLARGIRSFYIVNIIYAEVHPSLVPSLARRRDVAAILPNTPMVKADGTEIETGFSTNYEWNLEDIGVFAVHQSGINGSGVVVGIIDTGVDWNHPDLERRWRGYNPAGPANPDLNWYDAVNGLSMPYDDDGHGTHIAGIIAGENGTGVAPGATWIGAKAFDEFGEANPAWLLSAGEYMLAPLDSEGSPCPAMAPDIINNSWGMDSGFDEWYRPMVQAWRAAGILPIFAAGNGGGAGSLFVPANYPEVLAVAAVNPDNHRSIFSGEGPAPYSEICKPDLSAPGEDIFSTSVGGGYSLMSGTSVAAPHVTGIAALLLSQNPNLTPEILEAALKQTALPLTDSHYPDTPNWGYGYGLVQADAALALIREPAGIVQGKVSTPISGVSAPLITHTPVHEYYIDGNLPICAQIEDTLGVVKAEVTFRDSAGQVNTFPMDLVEGNNKSGTWWCWLACDLEVPLSLEYSIHIHNRAGLKSESGPHLASLVPGILPAYSNDFSQYPVGWAWDGDWEWGMNSSEPKPQQGDALFGTGLEKYYAPNTWSSLYAPPLDLSQVTGAIVSFQHWYDLAPGDSAQVFISTDNLETWEVLAEFEGTSPGWLSWTLDLSSWDNWPNPLILGFDLLAEKNGGDKAGWFIDKFSLAGKGPQSSTQNPPAEETQGDGNSGAIPLEAVITVAETGEIVCTGYADGIFSGSFVLIHPLTQTETPTLRVTARGYKPLVKKINVAAGQRLNLDLSLTPLSFFFQRLSGNNRYATAAAISQKGWKQAETVFLARGDNYADALAGVPLAYALNAPVLLTSPLSLPDSTRQELLRLGAKKVFILGGSSAIAASVETILNRELSIETERIFGANRFATAAEIARRLSKLASFDTAVIAYGNNFPDALSAAPFAAAQGMPILLTRTGQMPQETKQALEDLAIAKTLVAGGTNAVGAAVFCQLPLPLRLQGPSRYYTAVALAEHFQPQSDKLYLATGADFADAISGAVLAARDNAALLLLSDVVPYPVTEFILQYGTEEILFLGGRAVIPETIPEAIKKLEP